MSKIFLLTILCFSTLCSFAQQISYAKADSIARVTRKHGNTEKLAVSLTKDLTTEAEKARAIFTWVAENLSYQFGSYGTDANEVLKKGKAVCEGYSALFRALCMKAGLKAEIITGYSKTDPTDIGKIPTRTDHAWNAVMIDGKWQLVDVTWGSGFVDRASRKFTRSYDDFYFLTDPYLFSKTHYPADAKWFLTEKIPSLKDFAREPLYYQPRVIQELGLEQPLEGIIRPKKDKPLTIAVSSSSINDFTYTIPGKRYSFPLTPVERQGKYFLEIPLSGTPGQVSIYKDHKSVITFLVKN